MSATGDMKKIQLQRDMEDAENDLTWSGWEEFIAWVLACVLVLLAGLFWIAFDHIERFFKNKMREIYLSQGKVALVDDQDFEWLSQWKWSVLITSWTDYAVRSEYVGNYRQKTIRMHRFILGAKKGQEIDHHDRNGLNNQRNNLRFCSGSQNMGNVGSKPHTSKFKGVCRPTGYKKWWAQIKRNGKNTLIGVFDREEDAALAYDKAAIETFGNYARINFSRRNI